jgi:outer membrane protein assembly factor BamB
MWACIKIPPLVIPGEIMQFYFVFFGPMALTLLFLVWWLFFSRAPWSERFFDLAVAAILGACAWFLFDPTFGFMGVVMMGFPIVTTVWVGWLLLARSLSSKSRRVGLVFAMILAWAYPTLLRFDGVTGGFVAKVNYRWVPTNEELFLAEMSQKNAAPASVGDAKPVTLQPGDWPAFRGPERLSRLPGIRIATDWQQRPPKLLWKHRVGPGWSSFALVGNHLYTQEQRGANESVVCYDADSGKEIWEHQDAERFTEAAAGPGPRATPTFHEGKLYTLGASGVFNCLDAATGKVLWSRNIKKDSSSESDETKTPIWGFAASPLIVKGIVTVFAGGPNNKSVLAYNAATGEPVWSGGEGKTSYSSLQLIKVGGADCLVMATEKGLDAFDPVSGKPLWQHAWGKAEGMPRCVQPVLIGDSDILLGSVDEGMRRIHVKHEGDNWETSEVWTTRAIKPYYNDFVIHKDHAYGFDGIFFCCVNLADGKLKWKARGYENGQVLLLPDQDLLLIVTEKGQGALVEARPEQHKELAKMQMVQGKTWNHPVLSHGKLFVRSDEEAACYQVNDEAVAKNAGDGN